MACVITIMRHGPTEPGLGKPDADRLLTLGGEEVVRRVARGLNALGAAFDLGLSSPLVRARRTAELVWQELDLQAPLHTEQALAAGGDFENLLSRLAEVAEGNAAILVVGHMPDVARLTAHLVDGPVVAGFLPGGAARVRVAQSLAPAGGELEWLLRPDELADRSR